LFSVVWTTRSDKSSRVSGRAVHQQGGSAVRSKSGWIT
jgi:hypothetical protein